VIVDKQSLELLCRSCTIEKSIAHCRYRETSLHSHLSFERAWLGKEIRSRLSGLVDVGKVNSLEDSKISNICKGARHQLMPGGRMARLANYNDQNPEAFPAEEDPRHTRSSPTPASRTLASPKVDSASPARVHSSSIVHSIQLPQVFRTSSK
jgi:hypothetical protein